METEDSIEKSRMDVWLIDNKLNTLVFSTDDQIINYIILQFPINDST